jgi:hypothetical protein
VYDNAPVKFKLAAEVRKELDLTLLDECRMAVQKASDRDADLLRWFDMVHGVASTTGKQPWIGSCMIEDGLIAEQAVQIEAPMKAMLSRPLAQIEAMTPDGKEKAEKTELWLNHVLKKEKYAPTYGGFISNGVRYPTAVLYCGWQTKMRQERSVMYWDGESTDELTGEKLLLPEPLDPEVEYEEIPVINMVPENGTGAEYRVVNLDDFYPFPADTPSMKKALAVYERVSLSESELLDGIDEAGYDKDAVMRILKFGAGSDIELDNEVKERRDSWNGVQENGSGRNESGYFECFIRYGKLPKLWKDDKPQLPKEYWRDMFYAVICPAAGIVFHLEITKLPRYPYFDGWMMQEPGSFYGNCLCTMLENDQAELTHFRRSMANEMDLEIHTPTIMYGGAWELNKSYKRYPGAVIKAENQGDIAMLEQKPSAMWGVPLYQMTLQRAQAKAQAQGIGELGVKVRKQVEVQNVVGEADQKTSMFQTNLFRPCAEIFEFRVWLELTYNPNFSLTLAGQPKVSQPPQLPQGMPMLPGTHPLPQSAPQVETTVEITAEDLQGEFEFNVAGTDQNSSQEARIQRDQATGAILQRYEQVYMGVTSGQIPPQIGGWEWHFARTALMNIGERTPETLIGDAPPQPPMLDPMTGLPMQPGMTGGQPGGMPQTGGVQSLGQLSKNGISPHNPVPSQ